MRLPDAAWRDGAGLRAVVAALGDGVRVVGGAVRDTLLGLDVADIDLATVHPPREVLERLRAAGLKAVPTGLAHGTVTAVAGGQPFEVTTLRRDVATDGRHAEVAFTDDWQADAARRDFTINALYADPAGGEVTDFFGGIDDLAGRRVRFIGEPLRRIAEDHLRILRFFRFHARFGSGAPDPAALAACASRANDLMALSRERIREEFLKLLAVDDPTSTIATMLAHGVLAPVLPEIDAGQLPALAALVAGEAAAGRSISALRRLAALLPPDPTLLDDIAVRLRLSNAARRRLTLAAAPPATDWRATAYADGTESAVDRLLLAGRVGEARAAAAWTVPRLPASGRDLIARGVPSGPEISRRLATFERAWIAEGFPPDAAALLDRAARET